MLTVYINFIVLIEPGEKLYPAMSGMPSVPEDMSTVTETDDSLAQSVSLTTFDDSMGEMTGIQHDNINTVMLQLLVYDGKT